jgi:hypothetical protein
MCEKIGKYFKDLSSWGWYISKQYKDDGNYLFNFTRIVITMELSEMNSYQYNISFACVKLNNGKYVYVINHSDYYWTEDEVIEELKRIGIK